MTRSTSEFTLYLHIHTGYTEPILKVTESKHGGKMPNWGKIMLICSSKWSTGADTDVNNGNYTEN